MTLCDTPYDDIISLGSTCRARYQISRCRFLRRGTEGPFTLANALQDETHFFDWLISSPAGVASCLEHGFEDVFCKATLEIRDDGRVWNRRYGFRFDHAFSHPTGAVTPEIFDAEYHEQQAKFTYLAEKFLSKINGSARMLYLIELHQLDSGAIMRIRDNITGPDHNRQHHLLAVTYSEKPRGVLEFGNDYTIQEISNAINKPADYAWEGNDEVWDSIFDPIKLAYESKNVINQ